MPTTLTDTQLRDLAALLAQAGVDRALLVGSAAAGQLRPESDIDIVIESSRGPISLLSAGALQVELTALLERPVHLTLLTSIPAHVRDDMLRNARTLIAA